MKVFKSGFAVMYLGAFSALMSASNASVREASVWAVSTSKHITTAHSLGDDYTFDPRDGWQPVNVTNLQYKYRRDVGVRLSSSSTRSGIDGAVAGVLEKIFKGLKGIGKSEQVTITWYTGEDLRNPSCWANGQWTPTDESFTCALTLKGWVDRPKCFKFLEVCHTQKKCVFVRVVDTCAGCAPGSKHIDMTKAAFGALEDINVGQLSVQFRPATEPKEWSDKLWGPKIPI